MMVSKAFATGLLLAATVSIASAAEGSFSGGDAESCEEEFGKDFCHGEGPRDRHRQLTTVPLIGFLSRVAHSLSCSATQNWGPSRPCTLLRLWCSSFWEFYVSWSHASSSVSRGADPRALPPCVIRQSNHLLTVPEYFVARAPSSDSVVSSGAPASPTSRSWSVHANAAMMPASLCQALTNVACCRYLQGRSPTGGAWASCCGIFWIGAILLNLVVPGVYIVFSFVMIIPFCMDSCCAYRPTSQASPIGTLLFSRYLLACLRTSSADADTRSLQIKSQTLSQWAA